MKGSKKKFQVVGKYSHMNKVIDVWDTIVCLGYLWIRFGMDHWWERGAIGENVGKVGGSDPCHSKTTEIKWTL